MVKKILEAMEKTPKLTSKQTDVVLKKMGIGAVLGAAMVGVAAILLKKK